MNLPATSIDKPSQNIPNHSQPKLLFRFNLWNVMRKLMMITSLILAMYQFVIIDPRLIGFVIIWTSIPIFVITVDSLVKMNRFPRCVLLIYLLLFGFGPWLGVHTSILPGLGGLHPGHTDFAKSWNLLDIESRRLIAWNMGLSIALIFWYCGYGVGWIAWSNRNHPQVMVRPSIAIVILIVTWGIPLLSLLGFIPLLLKI